MKNVQQVNQYLADLSVWNVKLHNLHFNVTGPQFKSIHEYLNLFMMKLLNTLMP